MKATMQDLEDRVRKAIEVDEEWLYIVAEDEMSPAQMYENVKHTSLFRKAAMRYWAERTDKYRHLVPELEA